MKMLMKAKGIAAKAAAAINMSILSLMVMANSAMASTKADWDSVTGPVTQLCEDLQVPALTIVGAVGALYCIVLGVKFAKAEEQQDVMKAKAHLKNALIGFILIFILLAIFPKALIALGTYANLSL